LVSWAERGFTRMFLAQKTSWASDAVLTDLRFSFTKPHPAFLLLLAISSTDHPILRFDRASNRQSKMSQYTINKSNNCLNTTDSYNTTNEWNDCTVAEDLPPLLSWLSPLDPGLRHSDIQERRVNDVGELLITTEEFRRWSGLSEEGKGDEVVLFCYGNPGVGKTFIRQLGLFCGGRSEMVLTWCDDSSLIVL